MSVADILAALGQNAAQAQLRRSAVYGTLASSLASVPGQVIADRERERAVALNESRVRQQMDLEAARAERERELAGRQDKADAAETQNREHLGAIIGAGFEANPAAFDSAAAITKAQEIGRPDLIPAVSAVHDKFTKAPPKTREIKVRNADGSESIQIVEDTPGFTATSAAPPKPEPKLHPVTVPGPNGKPVVKMFTEEEMKAGVPSYERPRAPQTTTPNSEAMTPDAVEMLGTAYRLLGTRGLPTRISEADKRSVLNAAAKQAKDLGNTPAATIQKQAAYAGDSKALAKMQQMDATSSAFENKAVAQADIIGELSSKVKRTQFPIINAALQKGRTEITGDEDATKLANAISTFSAEYAKIIEGSTGSAAGSSDAARKTTERLVNAAMNQKTLSGVLDLMKREMALTRQGYGATINHITEKMGGTVPTTPTPETGAKKPTLRFNPATGKVEPIG